MTTRSTRALAGLAGLALATAGLTACSTPAPAPTTAPAGLSITGGRDVLPNLDDDGGRCKIPERQELPKPYPFPACLDSGDDVVNGPEDAKDLTILQVKAPAGLGEKATGTVTLTAPAGKTGLFVKNGDAWTALAAPGTVTTEQLKAGLTLGVEARDIIRDVAVWDGSMKLTVAVKDNQKTTEATHEMSVAKLRLHTNLDAADQIYSATLDDSGFNLDYNKELSTALSELGASAKVSALPEPRATSMDKWAQDHFEWLHASVKTAEGTQSIRIMGITPSRKLGWESWLRAVGPGIGMTMMSDKTDSTNFNMGGNIEALPSYSKDGKTYPAGRPIIGHDPKDATKLSSQMMTLFKAQGLDPLLVDTSLTHVSHIDEMVQVVPSTSARGWALMIASPADGLAIVQKALADGHGATRMINPKVSGKLADVKVRTVASVADEKEVVSFTPIAQAKIDAITAMLKTELGLSDADITRVPVLWAGTPTKSDADKKAEADKKAAEAAKPTTQADDGPPPIMSGGLDEEGGIEVRTGPPAAEAIMPNAINSVVLDKTRVVAAKQFGPIIDGKDLFAEAVAAAYRKHGITVGYADDFHLVHIMGGEWHCVTNPSRAIAAP